MRLRGYELSYLGGKGSSMGGIVGLISGIAKERESVNYAAVRGELRVAGILGYVIPVSYTHLDVYKRQNWEFLTAYYNTAKKELKVGFVEPEGWESMEPEDVYKRQPFGILCASPPSARWWCSLWASPRRIISKSSRA